LVRKVLGELLGAGTHLFPFVLLLFGEAEETAHPSLDLGNLVLFFRLDWAVFIVFKRRAGLEIDGAPSLDLLVALELPDGLHDLEIFYFVYVTFPIHF